MKIQITEQSPDDMQRFYNDGESPTPETDAAIAQYAHHLPNWLATDIIGAVARKLEREKNAAFSVISAIEERYIDGWDTYQDWKFMGGIAREFLSENVNVDLPRERKANE